MDAATPDAADIGWSRARIRDLRKTRHLTQQDLAVALGVALATVQRWESGAHAPTALSVRRLAEFEATP